METIELQKHAIEHQVTTKLQTIRIKMSHLKDEAHKVTRKVKEEAEKQMNHVTDAVYKQANDLKADINKQVAKMEELGAKYVEQLRTRAEKVADRSLSKVGISGENKKKVLRSAKDHCYLFEKKQF